MITRIFGSYPTTRSSRLSLFKLRCNKSVTSAFVLPVVFFVAATVASADDLLPRRISYRTQLGQDLDGDHKPETATIRQIGPLYQVSIHFTTGRPKIQLSTRI